jgi:hypothetical protein
VHAHAMKGRQPVTVTVVATCTHKACAVLMLCDAEAQDHDCRLSGCCTTCLTPTHMLNTNSYYVTSSNIVCCWHTIPPAVYHCSCMSSVLCCLTLCCRAMMHGLTQPSEVSGQGACMQLVTEQQCQQAQLLGASDTMQVRIHTCVTHKQTISMLRCSMSCQLSL